MGEKIKCPLQETRDTVEIAGGPAVPAVTMKLCTQWGDTTRGGTERCVEQRDQNRRKEGEQFRRPNAMTRYIPGMRGCTAECLPFCLPSIPSLLFLAPPTCTTTCYYTLPPCASGNELRNGNLIPASFHSVARTSIECLDIDRVGIFQ